jgi:CRP-like cAMP-binding protein
MIEPQDLQQHALFGGLSDVGMAFVQSLFKSSSYSSGDMIVSEGERGNRTFFICCGNVEVIKKGPSNSYTRLATLHEGNSFGEMELIDIQTRSASVRALDDLEVLTLRHQDMYAIFEQDKDTFILILMNISREISRRLRKMDALVASSLYGKASSLAN